MFLYGLRRINRICLCGLHSQENTTEEEQVHFVFLLLTQVYNNKFLRFLAMQKLAEEKKAEALKQMNSMPGVELDMKRHGPDGYHGGCRDGREGRGLPPPHTTRQHPKQVGGG